MTARHLLAAFAATLLLGADARGAGLPIASGQSSRAGAATPDGRVRVTARRAGTGTLLRRGDAARRIPGRWFVPSVALDGATTGLSADGGTLVLVHRTRSVPSRRTRLLVLDARRLAVRRRITLGGFFTVDAVAPDAAAAYLIQYAGADDLLDYRVRALDTVTGRLAPRDVVDPREDEQMGGIPFTRTVSPDGRWAYTLYGGGDETFIHALDTVGATAACVDLDMLAPGADLSQARLTLTPAGLEVRNRGRIVALVNTRTFAVSRPVAPAPPAPHGGFPWLIVVLVAAGIGGVVAMTRRPRGDVSITTRVP